MTGPLWGQSCGSRSLWTPGFLHDSAASHLRDPSHRGCMLQREAGWASWPLPPVRPATLSLSRRPAPGSPLCSDRPWTHGDSGGGPSTTSRGDKPGVSGVDSLRRFAGPPPFVLHSPLPCLGPGGWPVRVCQWLACPPTPTGFGRQKVLCGDAGAGRAGWSILCPAQPQSCRPGRGLTSR